MEKDIDQNEATILPEEVLLPTEMFLSVKHRGSSEEYILFDQDGKLTYANRPDIAICKNLNNAGIKAKLNSSFDSYNVIYPREAVNILATQVQAYRADSRELQKCQSKLEILERAIINKFIIESSQHNPPDPE